jgi:hypothetical protein
LVGSLVTRDPAIAAYAIPIAARSHARMPVLDREAAVQSTCHGNSLERRCGPVRLPWCGPGIGQGVVAWDVEVTNQQGELVASYDILTFVAKRT